MPRHNISTVENVVQVTSDYSLFSVLNQNRPISQGHVDSIKKAFAEVGNLTRVQPILVNERFEVIDGQHRLEACKQLEEPVYFTTEPGLNAADARAMNVLHMSWTFDDYLHSYAEAGNPHYVKFAELKEEYEINNSLLLVYVFNGQVNGMYQNFRKGDLTIDDLPAVRARLDKLAEATESMPILKNSRPYGYALLEVMKAPGYSQERMIRKIGQAGNSLLRNFATKQEFLRALEDVYNFSIAEGNRVRLY